MLILPGDFSFLNSPGEQEMLTDAYEAVTKTNSWLSMAKDPGVGGYMFSKEAEIYLAPVNQHIKYAGHSGASYGWTMRQMQYIATHSWEDYVDMRLKASD